MKFRRRAHSRLDPEPPGEHLTHPRFEDWITPEESSLPRDQVASKAVHRWASDVGLWYSDWNTALAAMMPPADTQEDVARVRGDVGEIEDTDEHRITCWARGVSVGNVAPDWSRNAR
ncbi:hypothetical protein AFL01nite_05200 [Aeromicrobium flavum]|uniref:Uncharacterized protein n=1 Tax=Aeromicrobium flavum TaxID=416568 RepID=A0A512HRW0_9ACTN|nr:hypothetical protein [Aeromicrobium flavum]GEO88193.1 hypothetical protein AFL01nite_05200 [Aeromicrobium flavum]